MGCARRRDPSGTALASGDAALRTARGGRCSRGCRRTAGTGTPGKRCICGTRDDGYPPPVALLQPTVNHLESPVPAAGPGFLVRTCGVRVNREERESVCARFFAHLFLIRRRRRRAANAVTAPAACRMKISVASRPLHAKRNCCPRRFTLAAHYFGRKKRKQNFTSYGCAAYVNPYNGFGCTTTVRIYRCVYCVYVEKRSSETTEHTQPADVMSGDADTTAAADAEIRGGGRGSAALMSVPPPPFSSSSYAG